jgi:hypothetical protein
MDRNQNKHHYHHYQHQYERIDQNKQDGSLRLIAFLSSSEFIKLYYQIVNYLKKLEGLYFEIYYEIKDESLINASKTAAFEKFTEEKRKIYQIKSLLQDLYQNPELEISQKVIKYSQTSGESISRIFDETSLDNRWNFEVKEFNFLFDQLVSKLIEFSTKQKDDEKSAKSFWSFTSCYRSMTFSYIIRILIVFFFVFLFFQFQFTSITPFSLRQSPTNSKLTLPIKSILPIPDDVLRYGDFINVFSVKSGTLAMNSKDYAFTLKGYNDGHAVILQVLPYNSNVNSTFQQLLSSPLIGQPLVRRNNSFVLKVVLHDLFFQPKLYSFIDIDNTMKSFHKFEYLPSFYAFNMVANDSDVSQRPHPLIDRNIYVGTDHPVGIGMTYFDGVGHYTTYLVIEEGLNPSTRPIYSNRQNLIVKKTVGYVH